MRSPNSFESLPDSLVVSILNKLPHVGVVRKAAASCKRFRELAKQVEELVIDTKRLSLAVDEQSRGLDIALMLGQSAKGALKGLKVVTHNHGNNFQASNVLFWIVTASASLRNLEIWDEDDESMGDMGRMLKAASLCPHLTRLSVSGAKGYALGVNGLRGCEGGFKDIMSLTLTGVDTSSQVVSELVALCPKLQFLELKGLKGVADIELASKTLEGLTLYVFPCWTKVMEGGFSSVKVSAPALKTLTLGDMRGPVVVTDAPLQEFFLDGFSSDLVVDLGSKAILRSVSLQSDDWPLAVTTAIRRTMSIETFKAILSQTTTQALRELTMPAFDPYVPITPSDSLECFQHMLELETLVLHASFIVGCCGFHLGRYQQTWGPVQQYLLSMDFPNLRELTVYLDVDSPLSFNVVEWIAKSSKRLRKLDIQGDSGIPDFRLPGVLISRILAFQNANPNIEVTIELPEMLGKVD